MRFLHALVLCLESKTLGYVDPLLALLGYCRAQALKAFPETKGAGANLGPQISLDARVLKYLNQKSDDAHHFESLFTEVNLEQSSDLNSLNKKSSVGGAEIGPISEMAPTSELGPPSIWRDRINRVIMAIVSRLLQVDDFIGALNLLRETLAADKDNISLLNGNIPLWNSLQVLTVLSFSRRSNPIANGQHRSLAKLHEGY